MEDMSSPDSFMEVSERYLAGAKSLPIFKSWQFWLIIGIIVVIGIFTYLWLRKKRSKDGNIQST